MEIRNRIKHLRKLKKISGIKLAEKLDISPPYLYDLEKGKRKLSGELAGRIAEIFKVTTDYLLCVTDNNLYDLNVSNELIYEDNKKPDPLLKESELWFDIPIEDLAKRELTYKGKKLNEEQRKQFAKIIQAAADMLNQ